jgi:arginyl-tRNA synthetase
LRAARLGLCNLTLAVLTKALDLLGIEVPNRM